MKYTNKQAFDFECYGIRRIDKFDYLLNIVAVVVGVSFAVVLLLEIFVTPNL